MNPGSQILILYRSIRIITVVKIIKESQMPDYLLVMQTSKR